MFSLKTNYFRRFLRYLTWRKLWNMVLVTASYYVSKFLKKPVQWGFPISVAIEPTTSCNLRCPECPSGLRSFSRPTGMLDPVFFKKVIDQLAHKTTYLTFYFQGEPYLNPNFLDMATYAASKGIYTSTSTNAHYLKDDVAKKTVESALERIIISIDGTTQEVYQQYRIGGNLEKVIAGTRNLIKWKKALNSSKPYVIFQYLVVKPNEHQLQEVQALAKELEVDEVKFKTAQVYDYENGNELIPDNSRYSRYKKTSDGKYRIKNELTNHCWKLWSSCVITWDGKIVPCCFDKDAQYQLGNLATDSFQHIWQNGAYHDFRKAVLTSRSQIDICQNCSEGTKVWA